MTGIRANIDDQAERLVDQVKENRRQADAQYLLRQVGRNSRLVRVGQADAVLGQSGAGMVSMHLGRITK